MATLAGMLEDRVVRAESWLGARMTRPLSKRLLPITDRGHYEFRCNGLEICDLHSKFVIYGLWGDG